MISQIIQYYYCKKLNFKLFIKANYYKKLDKTEINFLFFLFKRMKEFNMQMRDVILHFEELEIRSFHNPLKS